MDSAAQSRPTMGERLRSNPVSLKELRGRMRGARAFVVLTAYVLLMSGLASLLYLSYTSSTSLTVSSNGSVVGKFVFGGIVGVQFMLVAFVAPSLTVGAISGERERQTLDLLRTTLLPARSIVMGKLGSALSFVLLLLIAAVPLQSLAFLLGGVTIEEVLLALLLLVLTAITFSAVGLFFSSLTRRTLSASLLTYAVVLGGTFGLPLLAVAIIPVFRVPLNNISSPVLEAIFVYTAGLLVSINPVLTIVASEIILLQENTILLFDYPLESVSGASIPLISPWVVYVVAYSIASLLLIAAATRKVRQVEN